MLMTCCYTSNSNAMLQDIGSSMSDDKPRLGKVLGISVVVVVNMAEDDTINVFGRETAGL